ncbi:MAG: dTMP kinase [Armatimonadota bacterium]
MTIGRFITIEGPDGAGKSTLARALNERFSAAGIPTLLTREPGGSEIGSQVRDILLHGGSLDVWTEAFLFLADRRQHCKNVIRPALEQGTWVLCDRFTDSTLAYQGYAAGADLEVLRQLNHVATGGLTPDLTLLLDLPPEIALARLDDLNRLDRMPLEFHISVREGFLQEAKQDHERWRVIDATQSPQRILELATLKIAMALGIEAILAAGGDLP